MSLADYARKRRFNRTREPQSDRTQRTKGRAIFVVQLHHARHRHYDFRLQVGNTLRSWAVPKGPSLDPTVKRLAAEVEDHPVSYATFEGDIPAGEYGGGHVARFDSGLWSTNGDAQAQLQKGHLRFELFGDKLKGGWHLVRSHRASAKPQWLLIKEKDRHARAVEADDMLTDIVGPRDKREANKKAAKPIMRPKARAAWTKFAAAQLGAVKAAMPAKPPSPQLASPVQSPPMGDDWLHEIKWDGYRITAMIADGQVRLWSRNAIEWTRKLPDIVEAVQQLGLRDGVIDGELIARRGAQRDFSVLQSTLSGDHNEPLVYVLFDVLHVDGVSLMRVALKERKNVLAAMLSVPRSRLALSTHIIGDGARAFDAAVGEGFEGLVSKRANDTYHGGRGTGWLKTKTLDAEEFAVVGYTPPKGSRTGFGSLLLARRDGEGWRYVGKVGSGFSEVQLVDLRRRIGSSGVTTPSVPVPPNDTDLSLAKWFAPRFVVEVASRGRGSNGLLRQPSLKTIRLDKDIADMPTAHVSSKKKPMASSQPSMRVGANAATISSPGKLLFPADKITKQDVADYYTAVLPHLLPEIIHRPLSVIRCPSGIDGNCFFQKHVAAGVEGVDSIALMEKDGGRDDYLVVRAADAVMALVQANTLEFHPWGATAADPERCDRLVFDLDPGPGVAWTGVRAAARLIRVLLETIKLACFLRTSGGKGLHVVVPLAPPVPWDIAKPFAQAFAQSMVRLHPDRFVATATKSRRAGRIFVDYLRNGRGATSVASYSLRARPGAPVAMPIAWEELSRISAGDVFTLSNAPTRIAKRKADPWSGIGTLRQSLPTLGKSEVALRSPSLKKAVSKPTPPRKRAALKSALSKPAHKTRSL